jgi:hypothetical protein
VKPIARALSGDEGVYQVPLVPGDYFLCTNICTEVQIGSALIRMDWASGPGGGIWNQGICPA